MLVDLSVSQTDGIYEVVQSSRGLRAFCSAGNGNMCCVWDGRNRDVPANDISLVSYLTCSKIYNQKRYFVMYQFL